MSETFDSRKHFDSGRVAVCSQCEFVGESSWPGKWLLSDKGMLCPECLFALIAATEPHEDIETPGVHPEGLGLEGVRGASPITGAGTVSGGPPLAPPVCDCPPGWRHDPECHHVTGKTA